MQTEKQRKYFFILMFTAMLSWGGSWTSAKVIAGITAPEVLTFWRFLATFISFIPVVIYLKLPLKLERQALWPVLLGSALLVVYNKLFFWGLKLGLAGAGGVLVTSLIPVTTFLFSAVFFGQKIRTKEIAGLLLGLAGGSILLEIWKFDLNHLYQSGNFFFLLAAAVWGLLTITTQKSSHVMSPLLYSFYTYGISSLMDLIIAVPHDVMGVFGFGYVFWFNIFILSVVVTTFGTTAYFYASSKVGGSTASSFTFLVPFSALLISWVLLGEQPRILTVIGGIISLSAVYLINSRPKSTKLSATQESSVS